MKKVQFSWSNSPQRFAYFRWWEASVESVVHIRGARSIWLVSSTSIGKIINALVSSTKLRVNICRTPHIGKESLSLVIVMPQIKEESSTKCVRTLTEKLIYSRNPVGYIARFLPLGRKRWKKKTEVTAKSCDTHSCDIHQQTRDEYK